MLRSAQDRPAKRPVRAGSTLSLATRRFKSSLPRESLVFSAPKINLLEEDSVQEGFLEHAKYLSLREWLPDHQRLILVIGYHFGLRRGEILQLRWNQVDWQHNVLRLERKQAKGKGPVTPLNGKLRDWLANNFTKIIWLLS